MLSEVKSFLNIIKNPLTILLKKIITDQKKWILNQEKLVGLFYPIKILNHLFTKFFQFINNSKSKSL